MTATDERTPLFGTATAASSADNGATFPRKDDSLPRPPPVDRRTSLLAFLESRTPAGCRYEALTVGLIALSVITFVLASVFVPEYNGDAPYAEWCSGKWCDALWFGNRDDNALAFLGIGATSVTEMVVVGVFTVDYLLRLATADLLDPKFAGIVGRLRFLISFFSLVDLASTVPFYVDAFLLPDTDLAASTFLRMFRLLRMLKGEGRCAVAMGVIDAVLAAQRGMLCTALFILITVWGVLSSFFYIVERGNPGMIYCGKTPGCEDIDTSLCTMDEWGFVDCAAAGCPSPDGAEMCPNLFRSIPLASFWTLNALFGEYVLVDQYSPVGMLLGTFTAVFAVAVFALPVGVISSGFEDEISKQRLRQEAALASTRAPAVKSTWDRDYEDGARNVYVADRATFRGALHNFLHNQDTPAARYCEAGTDALIAACATAFMVDTVARAPHAVLRFFQFTCFVVFAVQFALRMYSAGENPQHRGSGRLAYASCFLNLVDVAALLPYLVGILAFPGSAVPGAFLLVKIFHFEKYTDAFTTFDDVLRENAGILTVTGFLALLLWIFFSSVLYYTERDNLDAEMAGYYKTIPDAMWITLLNLSGECPLGHYSNIGKVVVCIIGLFATAVFGVPIGILGSGFEELVTNEYEESPDEDLVAPSAGDSGFHGFQVQCYQFANGLGSAAATAFELSIYALIGVTVAVGVLQTVPGYEDTFSAVELFAVVVFTVEYAIRFLGASADPEFARGSSNGFVARAKYVASFYSIIDLLAIIPFYVAWYFPHGWVDEHDEYFRMMRLVRLLKLDKYVPSISLVDDVFRLKRNILVVTSYAAVTLWVVFAAVMYAAERDDHAMELDDPLPLYGCVEECSMSDRFNNYFNSFIFTGIHLTGDFPLVEYCLLGRVVLFFVVIAAVGVVSIPSGVIASGFAEIVQTKSNTKSKIDKAVGTDAGDDWYDIQYRQLEGQPPPTSVFGPSVDALQIRVKHYLDGTVDEKTGEVSRTTFSSVGRFFFFSLILLNVASVVLESIPEIDRSVGNANNNFFDVFEAWSVFFFTTDYFLRLFSARKCRKALYSPWVYSRTFFGIIDLVSVLPWYIQFVLARTGHLNGDDAKIFRIVRIFRVFQLEDFVVAFSKLDNVFRASKDVLKATGLLASIIWVGTSALFFIFEGNNPNFRECDESVPPLETKGSPGCYDFESTAACNEFYPDMCTQAVFNNMPNTMYYVSVFLVGEWGVTDFTWKGKLVCMFLCIVGIALYSIPVGTLFDSFGAIVGLSEDDEDDDEEE